MGCFSYKMEVRLLYFCNYHGFSMALGFEKLVWVYLHNAVEC